MQRTLDLSKFFTRRSKCPTCESLLLRPSRWRSKEEKASFQGFRPYRCDQCGNRFLAPPQLAFPAVIVNVAAGIALGVLMLAGMALWLAGSESPLDDTAVTAASMAAERLGDLPRGEAQSGALRGASPGTAGDPSYNVEWLRQSAESGNPRAMVWLARALAGGDRVARDPEQAAKWIQLAASAGNAEGMAELGRYYRDGVGMEKNPVRAYVWFSRAAAANHLEALKERDELVRAMSDESLKAAQKQLTGL